MADHFTYLTPFITMPEMQKFVTAIALAGGLVVLGTKLTSRLKTKEAIQENIVPEEKLSLFGFFDFFVESFLAFQDSVLGREGRKHAPLLMSVFLFVLLANLIGLIPGIPAITTTVWINVGMAFVVFFYYHWQGMKEHGVWPYLKHFGGPVWWLAWFIAPIEIFGNLLRVFTLNLRLYWNINADHIVLGIITDMAQIGAFPLYVLGTFVSFMQAFVFTLLTMVYILLATQHEEGHDEHH